MQQTEKYKLNLIEPSDPFLPDALNANTQKLEQVVSQHLEGMDQRVTVLESRKIAFGHYQGDNVYPRFFPLPFTPKIVFIESTYASPGNAISLISEVDTHIDVKLVDGGFQILSNRGTTLNTINTPYGYIALA